MTQGLAFGAGVPVIPVSDLRAVAQHTGARRVLVCNDARMKEVYWGCFEQDAAGVMQLVGKELVTEPEAVSLPEDWGNEQNVYGAGRGFAAYPELGERLAPHLIEVASRLLPHAREVVLLAVEDAREGRMLAPEEALPTYLRDDVARPKT